MIISISENTLVIKGDQVKISRILSHPRFKLKLNRYVSEITENKVIFKEDIHYSFFQELIKSIENIAQKREVQVNIDPEIYNFINQKDTLIQYKYSVGNDIKNKDNNYLNKFREFKNQVQSNMYRSLREQQLWDAFYMTVLQKTGNFSVPGSGKTSSVYGMYSYLRSIDRIDKIVMVGPKNSFMSWIDEFKACFGSKEFNVLNVQDFQNTIDKKRAVSYDSGGVDLILLNYEILPTLEKEVREIIDDRTLLVFDEVHKIKNPKGIRADSALRVSDETKYIVALTGTPIPNGYQDIFNFLNLIYPDDYNNFFGFSLSTLNEPSQNEVSLINDRIQPFFCRTTKEDLGVPSPNEDIIIEVDANQQLNEIFHILVSKYKKNALTFFIRVLQLESNPQMLLKAVDSEEYAKVLDIYNPNVNQIDFVDYSDKIQSLINQTRMTEKLNQLIKLSQKLVLEDKNIIIWCIFIDSMKNIYQKIKSNGISCAIISGETDYHERIKIINEFRAGNIKVLISNPHTLAESVSLHKNCHDAIYYEYSYNLVHLLQSKDRIHRLGLLDSDYTQYYFFQTNFNFENEPYSLSRKVYERLMEKEQLMIDAIDNHKLEIMPTEEEDIVFLFKKVLDY